MPIACPMRITVPVPDKTAQFALQPKGAEGLNWLEDSTGNPVVAKQDGSYWYAKWDSNEQKFEPDEQFTWESRKRSLKRRGGHITRQQAQQHMQSWTERMIEGGEDFRRKFGIGSPRSLNKAPILRTPGSPPAAGSIKRKISVIYVKFKDSASLGLADLTDAHIDSIFFDKSAFGSLAHYYHTQTKGAISIEKAGIYRVTLDSNGNGLHGDLDSNDNVNVKTDWIDAAVTKALAAGMPTPESTGGPICLLHGYETSFGGPTVAPTPRVWGHAYFSGPSMFGAYHYNPSTATSSPFNSGIVVHECGHCLFELLDLYDITPRGNGQSPDTVGLGQWSVMASGSWGYSASSPRQGDIPTGLDAYSLFQINPLILDLDDASGSVQHTSPYTPHLIKGRRAEQGSQKVDEIIFTQVRCFKDYDVGIPDMFGGAATPGFLIEAMNTDKSNTRGYDAPIAILEAHGGTQNLRTTTKADQNDGDLGDLFGPTKTSVGKSVSDPSVEMGTNFDIGYPSSAWTVSGTDCGFDIVNITAGSDCTGSYEITFDNTQDQDAYYVDAYGNYQKATWGSGGGGGGGGGEPEPEPTPPIPAKCDRPRMYRLRAATVVTPP